MSNGIAYYESEVYNIYRQGRNNPAVPYAYWDRTLKMTSDTLALYKKTLNLCIDLEIGEE